jgi:UDP-N-acetylglucosamine 2-epimerase (non-hydrolysing)
VPAPPVNSSNSTRCCDWPLLSTGQSAINFFKQWDDFKLPRAQVGTLLETKFDLHTSHAALKWFARAATLSSTQLIGRIHHLSGRAPNPSDFWIVHGDTLSTLIGSDYARRLDIPLAHIEAGLRSTHLFKPFPEEINRRLVSRMAHFHFPQDQRALENLKRAHVRGVVACTEGNTLMDAIQFMKKDWITMDESSPPYAVANLHRFENLHSKHHWEVMIQVLERAAARNPVHLVLHPPTQEKLQNDPSSKERLKKAGVNLLPRLPFSSFIKLLIGSQYVISDGGSNQEECYYLGKPCLLLRDFTERIEGLNGPCLLTEFKSDRIDRFMENPGSFATPEVHFKKAPSAVILDTLTESARKQATPS